MSIITLIILLIAGFGHGLAALHCQRGWYNMCYLADDQLLGSVADGDRGISIELHRIKRTVTKCVPLDSMPVGSDGKPSCKNLNDLNNAALESFWFENCCNYGGIFSQIYHPYCRDLNRYDSDATTSHFDNSCDYCDFLRQTCATVNGDEYCTTSQPPAGIKCTRGIY